MKFAAARKAALWLGALLCFMLTASSGFAALQEDGREGADYVPVIGIAWQGAPDDDLCVNTMRAVEAAGGKAVVLNQVRAKGMKYGEDGKLLDEYVDEHGVLLQECAGKVKGARLKPVERQLGTEVDGIIFTGGEDISPTLYKVPQPWHGIEAELDYNATRDVSEFLTLSYALYKDLPILGICRGMQMICVHSGATMIQDIPSWLEDKGADYDYTHRNKKVGNEYRDYAPHDVLVEDENTLLYSICGSHTITRVASWHHQAATSVEGTSLKISGVTETNGYNIIEAAERTDKTFCIGVQFHPEASFAKHLDHAANASSYMSYDASLAYFKRLVHEAKKHGER